MKKHQVLPAFPPKPCTLSQSVTCHEKPLLQHWKLVLHEGISGWICWGLFSNNTMRWQVLFCPKGDNLDVIKPILSGAFSALSSMAQGGGPRHQARDEGGPEQSRNCWNYWNYCLLLSPGSLHSHGSCWLLPRCWGDQSPGSCLQTKHKVQNYCKYWDWPRGSISQHHGELPVHLKTDF